MPPIVSSTPGLPSAARSLRRTAAVASADQSIVRSAWRHGGRGRPVTSGRRSPAGRGRYRRRRRTGHRLEHRLDRGVGDLVAVQRALARLARRNSASPRCRRRRSRRSPRRTVTPQLRLPRSIAQSSDDGPRSPIGPGCTIRQRCRDQTDSGMSVLSIGQTMRSGPVVRHRRLYRRGGVDDGDRDVVAEVDERDAGALAQAVVRRDQEQHALALPGGCGRDEAARLPWIADDRVDRRPLAVRHSRLPFRRRGSIARR